MISKVFSFFILLFCSFQLIATELGQLTPVQLEALQKQQHPLVVDIRTTKEWADTGMIADSQPLEFFNAAGESNTSNWLQQLKKLQKQPDQPIVLVCRSGNRSAKVGELLTKKLGMKNVYHLSNGILGWTKDNKGLEKPCPTNLACQ